MVQAGTRAMEEAGNWPVEVVGNWPMVVASTVASKALGVEVGRKPMVVVDITAMAANTVVVTKP